MNEPQSPLQIEHPSEIAAWLARLAEQQLRLELNGPDGQQLSLQVLRLQGQPPHLELRLPQLSPALPTWVLNGPVLAQAVLDRVRMEFELGARELLLNDGLPRLRLSLPARLSRHQRRQAFRVPPVSALHPRARLPRAAGATLVLRTADLSAGGIALWWPADQAAPQPGSRLEAVEIELARGQTLVASLRVQHVQAGLEPEALRVGCAFENLLPQAERSLQLHLNEVQRRQRLLAR